MTDLAEGLFVVEWGTPDDVRRANELCARYADPGWRPLQPIPKLPHPTGTGPAVPTERRRGT